MKLNQILAIEKGVKSKSNDVINNVYKLFQKESMFDGFTKKYRSKNEDDEDNLLPDENKRVTSNVSDMLKAFNNAMTELMDITYSKDVANTEAVADIVIEGEVIAKDVPSTFLIYLEKKLVDVKTVINTIPTLDINEEWVFDKNSNVYKTDKITTNRTKKITKALVLYEATDKHPAQVTTTTEDIVIGYKDTVKLSGAIPVTDKSRYLENVEKVLKAVRLAREEANNNKIESLNYIGSKILNKVFD